MVWNVWVFNERQDTEYARSVIIMRQIQILLCAALWCGAASGQNCDFKEYKAIDGLKAQMSGGALEIAWQGDRDQQLRVSFTIRNEQPTGHELAAPKGQGTWS